jgi:hypothetical protein
MSRPFFFFLFFFFVLFCFVLFCFVLFCFVRVVHILSSSASTSLPTLAPKSPFPNEASINSSLPSGTIGLELGERQLIRKEMPKPEISFFKTSSTKIEVVCVCVSEGKSQIEYRLLFHCSLPFYHKDCNFRYQGEETTSGHKHQ